MNHPDPALITTADQQMAWISTVCERGVRRPGFEADEWVTSWIADRFAAIGLDDVHLEPVPLPRWEPRSWSLHIICNGDETEVACFPLPHSAPAPSGLEATIRRIEDDPRDAIALDTVTLTRLPQSLMRDRALRHYDPTNEFDDLVQVLPFGRSLQNVLEPAMEAGAAAFIGIFDAPWETCDYYVPYDAIQRPIPGVWISRVDGDRVQDLLAHGDVRGRIVVDSRRTEVITHNVVGSLRGSSDDWVIIGSHHDGPWVSAVEDASGIALVLAQAEYWSAVPAEDRPHNLLFLMTSGHMTHGAGTAVFIAGHGDLLPSVVLEVHLEHTARECRGENGKLVPTEDPEVRWWFTSRNPTLVAAVEDAVRAEDLGRSLIVPPEVFGPHPTTDGGFFHLEDVPLVNFLTAPMYLFDSQDTIDKIHEASLEPVTRAAVRIIASTRGVSAGAMRDGVERDRTNA
ncbi:MAG: M28 family metallopeptidase [Actinomycetota bacterium]